MNKKQSTFANVSERDKKLLLILLSLIFLAGSYFFVFTPNDAKAHEIKEENTKLQERVDELEEMKEHEAEKKEQIQVNTQKKEQILEKFPDKMTQEKAIDELVKLEEEGEMSVSSVGFSMNEEFYNSQEVDATDSTTEQAAATQGTTGTAVGATPLVAYKSTLTVNYDATTLEGFRKVVDRINELPNKMAIESVTASFDSASGNLMGTMNICLYSLDNSKTEYEEPEISNVPIGMRSIFGTIESKKSER